MKRVLAFDFGASSGRALIGYLENGKIKYDEIHRFSNDPVLVNGVLYWDTLRLFFEIKQGIIKAKTSGGFDSIGIDTWGVDYGLIDKKGDLVINPIHYRDERTDGMMEKAFEKVPSKKMYEKTGIQFMRLNTVFQLVAQKELDPTVLDRAETLLFTPDLFAYMLTGEKHAEYSIASTSQLLDANKKDWAYDMMESLGFDKKLFPDIVDSGSIYGYLKKEICEELGVPKVPVISINCHDTASAVMAVPSTDKDFMYISSGTWSLMGIESNEPIINDESFKLNFTNEGGQGRTIRFLKNIMGLWIIQESRRSWIKEGEEYSFGELAEMAGECEALKCFIDVDDPIFDRPGNMPKNVSEYCEKTGQYVPKTIGEISRCIYESLAMKYRYVHESIEKLSGKKYNKLNVFGGGCKNKELCQYTADILNVEVIGGPVEATALGNISMQLIALGDIKDVSEAREIISKDEVERYFPSKDREIFDEAYQRFIKVIAK